jgi:hypothetical protein
MQKLLIAAIFVAFALAVSCQAPQDVKSQLDKQSAQIQTLEKTVQDQAVQIEQLKIDLAKKTGGTSGTTSSQTQPPTRVGR